MHPDLDNNNNESTCLDADEDAIPEEPSVTRVDTSSTDDPAHPGRKECLVDVVISPSVDFDLGMDWLRDEPSSESGIKGR